MRYLTPAIAAVLLTTSAATADEVTDTLTGAMEAYQDGDIQYALDELAYVTQLLNEMKADGLQNLLPAPLPGWTMTIDEDAASSMGFMGGGVMVRGEYSGGGDSFSITMMADNQMVLTMGAMLSNPQLMASMGSIERINRESFLNQDGDLSALVGNRVMIQAEGGSTDDMIAHLETMDFREIGSFGQ